MDEVNDPDTTHEINRANVPLTRRRMIASTFGGSIIGNSLFNLLAATTSVNSDLLNSAYTAGTTTLSSAATVLTSRLFKRQLSEDAALAIGCGQGLLVGIAVGLVSNQIRKYAGIDIDPTTVWFGGAAGVISASASGSGALIR